MTPAAQRKANQRASSLTERSSFCEVAIAESSCTRVLNTRKVFAKKLDCYFELIERNNLGELFPLLFERISGKCVENRLYYKTFDLQCQQI